MDYSKDPSLFRREAQVKLERDEVSVIVIDEIQRVPLLLNEVHFLIEKFRNCRFVMTGSSPRKLRAAGTNLLAGRAVERCLFPFTEKELGNSFELEDALLFGTLPSVCGLQNAQHTAPSMPPLFVTQPVSSSCAYHSRSTAKIRINSYFKQVSFDD